MRKADRKRYDFLLKVEERFLRLLDKLESQFINGIIKELETILIIEKNKISSVSKNHVNLNKLNFFQDNFRKRNVLPLVSWIATQLVSISKINATYFKEFNPKGLDDKIRNDSLSELGVKITDKAVKITKNSFLDQLSRMEDPYMAVRRTAAQAISQGMDITAFRKVIRESIAPEGKYGRVKHHFHTIANDVFSSHDRNVQKMYGNELGLRAFIYTGGLIKTSRDFCEERNGKVFTIEEAQKWSELEWEGKPAIYDPLTNMGGYNCRHFTAFIGRGEAIRRRPELKKYYDELEN